MGRPKGSKNGGKKVLGKVRSVDGTTSAIAQVKVNGKIVFQSTQISVNELVDELILFAYGDKAQVILDSDIPLDTKGDPDGVREEASDEVSS